MVNYACLSLNEVSAHENMVFLKTDVNGTIVNEHGTLCTVHLEIYQSLEIEGHI